MYYTENILNKCISYEKNKIISEPSYIEFPISNWDNLKEKEYQIDFTYYNYKWLIVILIII